MHHILTHQGELRFRALISWWSQNSGMSILMTQCDNTNFIYTIFKPRSGGEGWCMSLCGKGMKYYHNMYWKATPTSETFPQEARSGRSWHSQVLSLLHVQKCSRGARGPNIIWESSCSMHSRWLLGNCLVSCCIGGKVHKEAVANADPTILVVLVTRDWY